MKISFKNILNRSGPRMEPWRTPVVTSVQSLYEPFIENLCCLKKKHFMAPFYGWGSTASRLEPLRGGSLLFTYKCPKISGTHFIHLGRMKG